MWLDEHTWTQFDSNGGLTAELASLQSDRDRLEREAQQALRPTIALAGVAAKQLLEDKLMLVSEFSRRLDRSLTLLALADVLAKYSNFKPDVRSTTPIGRPPWMRWFRLNAAAGNGASATLFVTRSLSEDDVPALFGSEQLACVNYDGYAPADGGTSFISVTRNAWPDDLSEVSASIERALLKLGMILEPVAQPGQQRESPVDTLVPDTESEPVAIVVSKPVEIAGSDSQPAGPTVPGSVCQWDSFVLPIRMTLREIEAELEVDCLATRADASRMALQAFQDYRGGQKSDLYTSLLSALNTVSDADLLVTFARMAHHLANDVETAELLFRRAAENSGVENAPARWYAVRFMLDLGRLDEARQLAASPRHLAGSTQLALAAGDLVDKQALEAVMLRHRPISGTSLSNAATLWWQLFDSAPPDPAMTAPPSPPSIDSALRLLGQARYEEERRGLRWALPIYARAANEAVAADSSRAELPVIAHLRAEARSEGLAPWLDPGEDQVVTVPPRLTSLWRQRMREISHSTALRKQYLVLLMLTNQTEAKNALRDEFLAVRSAA